MILYGFVIFIHVVASFLLIAVILLQAGRGGGLSDTFGSDSSQTIFGTKASVFLTKATVVAACLFLFTSLFLGIMTSRRGRSLIDLQGRIPSPVTVPANVPAEAAGQEKSNAVDTGDIPLAEPEKLPQK